MGDRPALPGFVTLAFLTRPSLPAESEGRFLLVGAQGPRLKLPRVEPSQMTHTDARETPGCGGLVNPGPAGLEEVRNVSHRPQLPLRRQLAGCTRRRTSGWQFDG
jgi:hypothetical protein